jgi:sugar transferase (PEP-CTERM/EpsH1 system associated)
VCKHNGCTVWKMRIGESMKKKVVHLVYSMGCGGLEKVIVNLINGSSDAFEHVIVTLIPEFEMTSSLNEQVELHCLHKRPGKDVGCHKRLYSLLREISPDVINTYNFGTIEYHITAYLAGVKTRVHSDHGHGGDAQDGLNKKNNFIRKISSYFINDYVVVSKDLMEWVTQVVKVRPGKLHLIQNGVDVPPSVSPKYNATNGEKVICTVGRLDPVKNQSLLLHAFKRVLEEYKQPVRLKIVGDGPERKALESLAETLGIQQFVDFMGYREDVREQLETCNVFVLSSHYEAMPMTILESMAIGRPVVTTDVGGIRHFLNEDYASFVAPGDVKALTNELVAKVTNPANSEEQIINAHKLVLEKYSLKAMAYRYSQIYQ